MAISYGDEIHFQTLMDFRQHLPRIKTWRQVFQKSEKRKSVYIRTRWPLQPSVGINYFQWTFCFVTLLITKMITELYWLDHFLIDRALEDFTPQRSKHRRGSSVWTSGLIISYGCLHIYDHSYFPQAIQILLKPLYLPESAGRFITLLWSLNSILPLTNFFHLKTFSTLIPPRIELWPLD